MSSHATLEQNLHEWMSLINRSVNVKTNKGDSYAGYVYTVDPVSQSVVLVRLSDDSREVASLKVVFGHAVESIAADEAAKSLTAEEKEFLEKLFKPEEIVHDQESVLEHRGKLWKWLVDNKVPVNLTIDFDGAECLNISDALLIRPPYTSNDCQCANVIMLSKVQTLIANMPL
ncbi:hypothetical protein CAPTEDRAFT_164594 [Capitella teleta]|uniref:AD domain-containing protein n=1 Tax=Capitella teleta TaxID=283909 RepID=R7UHL8_CAPTE|nr:hypothetical protein CAPTEDRAFT_164594 [Capitella teleta]|eukprot:ELU02772.1 hypothetical protein CAPTEDRAFT_164594 [Capitella teleta]